MKIKQKQKFNLLLVLMTLMLSFVIFPTVKASASDNVMWDSYEVPSRRLKDRLVDAANLVSDEYEGDLRKRLDEISEKWQCNVVILTVYSHSGPIQDYADDYFDYNGFGADYNDSGILFMLSMEDREWAISTKGKAIGAFTDYGQEHMVDNMLSDLGDGYYYSAFDTYIDTADRYLELYESGEPYDVNSRKYTQDEFNTGLVICIILGFILAFLPLGVMISSLKTVHWNQSASGYQSHSGIHLNVHRDQYIRSSVTKTAIPKDNGRSSGGGSSVHTSSSGGSHGGSHGHF